MFDLARGIIFLQAQSVAGWKETVSNACPGIEPTCLDPLRFAGEFEQARPLLEAIRNELHWPVLLSFFSPSGYLVRKDYPGAEQVIYLPLDTPENARQFFDLFQPRMAIMVKYDLWFNHLRACQTRNIPLLLISAHFSPDYWIFKRWATWFRTILFGLTPFLFRNALPRRC